MSDDEKFKRIFTQVNNLEEKHHELELQLCAVTGTLKRVEDHINDEENVVKNIYDRINKMDNELKDSFKSRDDKIVDLRIEFAKMNTKLLVYAGVIFFIISMTTQFFIKNGIV